MVKTIKDIRQSQKLSQKNLARFTGVSEPAISRIESGDLPLSLGMARKMARKLRVKQSELMAASFKSVGDRAIKSDDPAEILAIAAKAHIYEVDEREWPELREAARDVADRAAKALLEDATKAVKQTFSQRLAEGVTGTWSTPSGSTLDPDLDPSNLRVASDGSGTFYVLDMVAGTLVLTFGNVVQQQGQPAGSKSATNSATKSQGHRDLLGRANRNERNT